MSNKQDPNSTVVIHPQTDSSNLDSVDFSSLTLDTRKERRYAYRGTVLASRPNSLATHRWECIDVSRSGLGVSAIQGDFTIGQEIQLEFFGPGAPAVQGSFKIVNQSHEVKNGKASLRMGLVPSRLSKHCEKNFTEFVAQLQSQSGFDFSDAR